MRILRWEMSRKRAFLIGGTAVLVAAILVIAVIGRPSPGGPIASSPEVLSTSSTAPSSSASSSVASSSQASPPPPPPSLAVVGNKEIGTWIWTPVAAMSRSTMTELVDEAAANHFNTIYLSIDEYLDLEAMPAGPAQETELQNFSAAVYDFISIAHQKDIAVDAEAGETDWGEPPNYGEAYAILQFVESFNATHDGKFRGVQYDVEAYSLPEYTSDPATVLTQYVGLVGNLVDQDEAYASSPSFATIPLTMIVPYFYTPDSYDQIVSLLGQLPSGDGRVIVLAYRNIASGPDGSISLAQPEISAADSSNVKVIIAQETGNAQPSSITFYGMPKTALFSAVQQINTAFTTDRAYSGVAVDYLQSFVALQ